MYWGGHGQFQCNSEYPMKTKQILVYFPGLEQGKLFNPDARDACLDPFIYLRNRLEELGYALETADDHDVEECSWVWLWDAVGVYGPPYGLHDIVRLVKSTLKSILLGHQVGRRQLYQESIRAGLRDRIVLFLFEPPAVRPLNWDPRIHKLFPLIFTWNDSYVDEKKFHKFCLPLTGWFPDVPDIPYSHRKLLVNISGNKFSSHPRELYTARRETIKYFEQHYPEQFDLYGTGWNQPRIDQVLFSSYRGTVKHKWDVYPRYRFGLCYESMCDEPGYITEKLFDCMRAKCVPIYWGAPNVVDYVDVGTFIDRRKFRSNAELADFLLSLTENEYAQYRQAIQAYLRSDRFAAFLPPAFADNVIRVLSL